MRLSSKGGKVLLNRGCEASTGSRLLSSVSHLNLPLCLHLKSWGSSLLLLLPLVSPDICQCLLSLTFNKHCKLAASKTSLRVCFWAITRLVEARDKRFRQDHYRNPPDCWPVFLDSNF